MEKTKADFVKQRDLFLKEMENLKVPLKIHSAEGGYFVMVNIEKCLDLIPEKYLQTNDYEDDPNTIVIKNDFGTPVPRDLAFCRWLAIEKKVIAMPGTFFYYPGSDKKTDTYIRLAICRGDAITQKAIELLKQ